MNKVSSSPDRHTFQAESSKKKLEENPNDENAAAILELYEEYKRRAADKTLDPEWYKNNLEADLRTTEWICEKVRADERYAQNLYAAMCNRDFVKLEVIPVLKEERWSCSWRYAGGIIADMRQEGDYIDWYCSGIRDIDYDEEVNKKWDERKYVSEGQVTDEIREDLKKLGWAVLDEDQESY